MIDEKAEKEILEGAIGAENASVTEVWSVMNGIEVRITIGKEGIMRMKGTETEREGVQGVEVQGKRGIGVHIAIVPQDVDFC